MAKKSNGNGGEKPPPKRGKRKNNQRGDAGFAAWFTHYRTGKKYFAKDYGYDAWPIGRGR